MSTACYVMYTSPIGPIQIVADSMGITEVEMQFGKKYSPRERSGQGLLLEEIQLSSDHCCRHLKDCITWLDMYFKGDFDKLKVTKFPQLKILNKSKSMLTMMITMVKSVHHDCTHAMIIMNYSTWLFNTGIIVWHAFPTSFFYEVIIVKCTS